MTTEKPYSFVIVGGGTAGWISALYLRYKMPTAKITLVESESIGILGAGEGTTPAFVTLLQKLRIPLSRLIDETSSTIKNGIKFTNWTKDSNYYYHGFFASDDVGLSAFDNPQYLPDTSLLLAYAQANGKAFSEINFCEDISEKNKIALFVHPEYDNQFIPDPLDKYFSHAHYANHFDAATLASFFQKVAVEERNITRIEGKVVDHKQHDNGDLYEVVLESGESVEGDFFIDCTGFARKFIGKVYGSEWVSHKEQLTVDSAMPFFLPIDEKDIPAYTESTAMKYGWMWKIPLQHRYGCGYVFDSKHTTEEEVKEEIRELVGDQEITWPRENAFQFEPGYYKTPWTNNCIAVGLSGAFIEPLEATSIWASIIYLETAFKDVSGIIRRPQAYVDDFNSRAAQVNEDIFEFVYFHYMGGRSDNKFWEHYQNLDNAPKRVKDMLTRWEQVVPTYTDYRDSIFPLQSWVSVAAGLGHLNTELYEQVYKDNELPEGVGVDYESFLEAKSEIVETMSDHVTFIKDIKENIKPIFPVG